MTVIFEIDNPCLWEFGKYESDLITRYWFLWFAVSFLRVPFRKFCETPKVWKGDKER
jgi:hypothetical protein